MEESKFYAAIHDKQVQSVFQMPEVQQLFALLQRNPEKAQAMLKANRDPRFQRAVALLMEKGLFSVQSK